MKTATYKRLSMTIEHAHSRGRYIITATVNGTEVKADTTDAEIYDYFDCDYYDKNNKNWARRAAYNAIQGRVWHVTAYRQGGNWVCNINGNETKLHYSITTKADVLRHFRQLSEQDFIAYKVTFA